MGTRAVVVMDSPAVAVVVVQQIMPAQPLGALHDNRERIQTLRLTMVMLVEGLIQQEAHGPVVAVVVQHRQAVQQAHPTALEETAVTGETCQMSSPGLGITVTLRAVVVVLLVTLAHLKLVMAAWVVARMEAQLTTRGKTVTPIRAVAVVVRVHLIAVQTSTVVTAAPASSSSDTVKTNTVMRLLEEQQ